MGEECGYLAVESDPTSRIRAEVSRALINEADWLDRAHAASRGYSEEYRRGFKAAAGWVRLHGENPHLLRRADDDE